MLHCPNQSRDHLCVRDQSQTPRALACSRNRFAQCVERHQCVRPPMARSGHIPRTQHGRVQTRGCKRFLTMPPDLGVRLHDRSRVRHAQIHEVPHAGSMRGLDSCHRGGPVDRLKLGGLPRRRLWRPHQLNERLATLHQVRERLRPQRIARDNLHTRNPDLPGGPRAKQRPHPVSAPRQFGDQRPPQITRTARDKDHLARGYVAAARSDLALVKLPE